MHSPGRNLLTELDETSPTLLKLSWPKLAAHDAWGRVRKHAACDIVLGQLSPPAKNNFLKDCSAQISTIVQISYLSPNTTHHTFTQSTSTNNAQTSTMSKQETRAHGPNFHRPMKQQHSSKAVRIPKKKIIVRVIHLLETQQNTPSSNPAKNPAENGTISAATATKKTAALPVCEKLNNGM